jgi:hypothetical protein
VNFRTQRTEIDWTEMIKYLEDVSCPDVEIINLVLKSLNSYSINLLCKAFPTAEARRIARRLDAHHTPIHGSRLNITELELNRYDRAMFES